jgi:hypothetical protein
MVVVTLNIQKVMIIMLIIVIIIVLIICAIYRLTYIEINISDLISHFPGRTFRCSSINSMSSFCFVVLNTGTGSVRKTSFIYWYSHFSHPLAELNQDFNYIILAKTQKTTGTAVIEYYVSFILFAGRRWSSSLWWFRIVHQFVSNYISSMYN